MPNEYRVLAINPGSTSTKIACYDGERCVLEETLSHSSDELSVYGTINEQLPLRRRAVLAALEAAGIAPQSLSAVVGRGGLIHPVDGGTYRVNQRLLEDLMVGVLGAHASNLGGILADELARAAGSGIAAFIVDPVVVDELEPEARVTGIPQITRTSIFHALNQKAVGRRVAADLGRRYDEIDAIVCHMGGGISVGAHRRGRVVYVSDALNGEGPFSPERCGTLPALKVARMCFSGDYTETEIVRLIKGGGGLVAHLGTNDGREIVARINAGDSHAETVYRAMALQVAREIAAAAAALGHPPDRIALTGGLAHDELLVGWIRERIDWIAPIVVHPGEFEMIALVEGALRVLRGEEAAREYAGPRESA